MEPSPSFTSELVLSLLYIVPGKKSIKYGGFSETGLPPVEISRSRKKLRRSIGIGSSEPADVFGQLLYVNRVGQERGSALLLRNSKPNRGKHSRNRTEVNHIQSLPVKGNMGPGSIFVCTKQFPDRNHCSHIHRSE